MSMLSTSAVEKLKDHQFSLVLPSIGGVGSNINLKQSIADYTTPMNPQYSLDRRFKWQVGLSELSYSNTIYTVSSMGNTITLLAPGAGGTYTRHAGQITANEYLSPQAFVTQFNADVAAIISAVNTKTAGTFSSNASVVLSYDPTNAKMTVKHRDAGIEILVRNGSDILKVLGQADTVPSLTDLLMPPVMPLAYEFSTPSDYLTKTWKQVAMTDTGVSDDGQGHGNAWITLQVWVGYDASQGEGWNRNSRTVGIDCYRRDATTSITEYLAWLNDTISYQVREVRRGLSDLQANDASMVYCKITALSNGKMQIDCKRVKIIISNDSRAAANATWVITNFGFAANLTAGSNELAVGDGSVNVIQLQSADLAQVVIAKRCPRNKIVVTVGPDTTTLYTIEPSPTMDYTDQASFVNELNAKIAANALLKTALDAVNGYIRFSLVAATATVPQHIALSTYMATIKIAPGYYQDGYYQNTYNGTDVVRLLGKNFATSSGSFTLTSKTPWLPFVTFNNPSPLMQMPRSLYIYLPDLIADANVAGIETTLLRCVQMVGAIGTVQTYEPQYIQWHDVTPSGMRLSQIHVVLRNAFGEIAQFEWGSITLTIQFRPIMAAITAA